MAKPETLKRALIEQNVPADIVHAINKDFADITDKSLKTKKAGYLFHAMNVLDAALDEDTRRNLMHSCACTIGSSVEKKAEQFAKKTQGLPLEEKVRRLREIKHLGNPVLQEDGTILVQSGIENGGTCRCPCPQISGVGRRPLPIACAAKGTTNTNMKRPSA